MNELLSIHQMLLSNDQALLRVLTHFRGDGSNPYSSCYRACAL